MKIVINAQTWPGLAFNLNPIALELSDARDMPSAEDPRPVRVDFISVVQICKITL